jgi:hypothetical protein
VSFVSPLKAKLKLRMTEEGRRVQLGAMFKSTDMDKLSLLLGMHIAIDRRVRTTSMDMRRIYVKHVVVKHIMTVCKPSSLLMHPGFMLSLTHINSRLLTGAAKDVHPSLLGNMQYAAVCTRPYLSTALSILGSIQFSPTEAHLQT